MKVAKIGSSRRFPYPRFGVSRKPRIASFCQCNAMMKFSSVEELQVSLIQMFQSIIEYNEQGKDLNASRKTFDLMGYMFEEM